jgi:pimeloyl-ACP methyl ester carboxylesterase
MDGTLIRYGPKAAHVAFITKSNCVPAGPKRAFVAVGGLSCGLLFAEYLHPLCDAVCQKGYDFVQPMLSSSLTGWGCVGISNDADELRLLFRKLRQLYGYDGVVILGHSTGCQDAVMYARKGCSDPQSPELSAVILQGPVSDREFLRMFPTTEERIKVCKDMMARGERRNVAFVFEEFGDPVPIMPERWLNLADMGGEDDMFSSDLSDDDLEIALSSLRGIPTLVLMSGADECQCPIIEPEKIGHRIKNAINGGGSCASLYVVENGCHDLKHHTDECTRAVVEFLDGLQG